MSNSYILSIETATNLCSVSLSNHGQNLCSVVGNEPNLHATKLTVFIQELMDKAAMSLDQLAAVAVSMGPGSYTGLRIGVSTAKGLCYALDIPLIANNTLEALKDGFMAKYPQSDHKVLLLPMIDARRREVYTAVFHTDGSLYKETEALIIDEHTFDGYLNDGYRLILFGSGADKFMPTFENNDQVQVIAGFDSIANFQDEVSYKKFVDQKFEDVAYFEPFYLKDFVATTPKKSPLL
ncbi:MULTISPECIES: tRNA (adenosine(37)-N6)-threonylcarbamoyltransferase complex dimerization subunit type 1 TsaB [unclassified Sphingobacterium]|uniref:tRNA (adenosine(37)-N6)-threonylcarbamoyltransferase complex dimerization subunit type 1 TsaB n=1 Tax=unclassified Sphingobacterium TaxID=2609468 RepID=UPI0020C2E815|nr:MULTISPECIES: tRNA (adenosine(37)-N6)-threonylcarbamoyltransferase complex dimerization subunit type 1 TsaB [unclassified Sphingobacterium]